MECMFKPIPSHYFQCQKYDSDNCICEDKNNENRMGKCEEYQKLYIELRKI